MCDTKLNKSSSVQIFVTIFIGVLSQNKVEDLSFFGGQVFHSDIFAIFGLQMLRKYFY